MKCKKKSSDERPQALLVLHKRQRKPSSASPHQRTPVTDGFASERANYAQKVSISWHHHHCFVVLPPFKSNKKKNYQLYIGVRDSRTVRIMSSHYLFRTVSYAAIPWTLEFSSSVTGDSIHKCIRTNIDRSLPRLSIGFSRTNHGFIWNT